jgi:hypothetical protein
MPFALAWLVRELMAHERPFHLEFPRCCLAETFGSATVRLDLWHNLLGKNSLTPLASREISPGITLLTD